MVINVEPTTMKITKVCGFQNPSGVIITMILVETNSLAKRSWGLMGRLGFDA
jgi:hypothetical protein